MPTVQELYELWADDSELRAALQRSLEPRGTDWLFEAFAALGPERGQLVVDVGSRNARHAIRLVREHGVTCDRARSRVAAQRARPRCRSPRPG